jgi:signal transduction histidine kinase
VDASALVLGAEAMLREAVGAGIEVVTNASPALWTVRADAGRLTQVLLDLALNARDAMPCGGTLMVETANVDLAGADARRLRVAPGQYVALTVRDTGTGMSAEVRSRIFEPFFTTSPRGERAGLGLSAVLGTVEQSGGRVWCDSVPGGGSAFIVYLPRHARAMPPGETVDAADTRAAMHAGAAA